MENLYKELALLTDDEAELCLNGLLKGLTIRTPEYDALLKSPEEMKEVIKAAFVEDGTGIEQISDVSPQDRPRAVRMLLVEIAENDELGPKLRALLEGGRPTLLDPITTSLVLAGIVLVLSTNVEIGYEKKNGKKHFKIRVKKNATQPELLKKFFSIFK
jgi:hypothetical protein